MLKDFEIRDGRLLVKNTGAAIPLDTEFFREFSRGARFVGEVSAISAARLARSAMSGRGPRLKIGFYPVQPHPWYAIWPVCRLGGLDIVRDLSKADILFFFEDAEIASTALPAGRPVVNHRCTNITKSKVAEVFEAVFGYPLTIDPHRYHGLALRKSERNGVHDGQIVPCPMHKTRPGHTYQRLIDNSRDGLHFIDIRTPIVDGDIPVVYLKHRSFSARFSNDNHAVTLSDADTQFTKEEQTLIARFSHEIGLDFGGIDVLRDRRDGRIYIVDVNKTDMGPPTALPAQDKMRAMRLLADRFAPFVRGIAEGSIAR